MIRRWSGLVLEEGRQLTIPHIKARGFVKLMLHLQSFKPNLPDIALIILCAIGVVDCLWDQPALGISHETSEVA